MARTFTFDVFSDGYEIYINGNPHADIVQQGYMPFVDNTLTVGTVEYYTKCAELNIAELQKEDLEVENYVTDMEKVVSYGVMSTPALVVNEKVVSIGKTLKAADVEKLLHKLGF